MNRNLEISRLSLIGPAIAIAVILVLSVALVSYVLYL